MTIDTVEPSYEKYRGRTASDISFEEFLGQLYYDDCAFLSALNANLYLGSRGKPAEFELYSTAWWEGSREWIHGEIEPTTNITLWASVVVKDDEGHKLARVEGQFHAQYDSLIPFDDEAFARFSESRLLDDLWPNLKQLVDDLMDRIDLSFKLPPRK